MWCTMWQEMMSTEQMSACGLLTHKEWHQGGVISGGGPYYKGQGLTHSQSATTHTHVALGAQQVEYRI